MSDAGICVDICVAFTKFVVIGVPFHSTLDWLVKLVPFTLKVNA